MRCTSQPALSVTCTPCCLSIWQAVLHHNCIRHLTAETLNAGYVSASAGVLSSAISVLAVMRLASWFLGRGAMVFELELYGGLLLFTGYVLFDTQVRSSVVLSVSAFLHPLLRCVECDAAA